MIAIKDFSERTGFSIRMLRYLEEVGLLAPTRDKSNYRKYNLTQVEDALKIKHLQSLGVQLKEIEAIQSSGCNDQLEILEKVLKREQDIAEVKSDSIPQLKSIIDYLKNNEGDFNSYLKLEREAPRKMRTLGGEDKFRRVAYNIPILKNIYEDHLADNANIDLIATNLIKFGHWYDECDYDVDVFSVLRETSFVFGNNITDTFVRAYENSWSKFLPKVGFERLHDFSKEDVGQLMGTHDLVIRTTFSYLDSGVNGEIVIPYSPIFTMIQLNNKI